MTLIKALILGLIQGLTEFFPVSSSSHLHLIQSFFHIDNSEGFIFFELMCHLGTLVAAMIFFRKDIIHLLFESRADLKVYFVALIPMPFGYLLFKECREWIIANNLLGYFLVGTAVVLLIGQYVRFPKREAHPHKWYQDALLIGAMQSCALLPGISRSALTISTARALGWNTSEAVRFSFLLSIPTIVAGNLFQVMKISNLSVLAQSCSISLCLTGFIISCMTGLATIGFAIHYLEKGNLLPFVWYCLCFATLTFVIYHYG
jgi:undecaprenyl-diphosphatase